MNIGIIAAEEEELNAIQNITENISEKEMHHLHFIEGEIEGKNCILVKSGVGKVNAASTTQMLIDYFDVDCIINIGSAGSVNPELHVEDIVIGKQFVQYDFDITGLGNYEKGEICDIGTYIKADEKLVNLCEKIIEEQNFSNLQVKMGTIASADMFCADSQKAEEIRKTFHAECVEMEGASIAQVCYLNQVPFLVIRGISDTPNGNNAMDFHTYLISASQRAADILKILIKCL